MLALDLETYPIAPGMLAPKPVSFSIANNCASTVGLIKDLNLPNEPIVGCNIAFDMGVLYQHTKLNVWGHFEAGSVTDVEVREQLLDIARGLGTSRSYSLKSLAQRVLGVKVEKEDTTRMEYYKVDGVPVEQWPKGFTDYALKDAEITYQIWAKQEQDRFADHMHRWEGFETYSAFCLHLMAVWGIRADPEHWASLKRDTEAKYTQLIDSFKRIGVIRLDGTKDKKLLQSLVSEAYNGSPPRTAKGGISTDRLTLQESGSPVLESLTGDGPIEKIVTTYGKVIEEAAARVYNPRYNVLVSSGRTSGNFQQWPRGGSNAPNEVNRLRPSFKARKGYLYCSVDFTGAELVSLAQVCFKRFGYSKLRDALNSGQNVHTRLASTFIGCSYESAQARLKLKDSVVVNARQGAKPVNFGVPGLMGPQRLYLAAHKDFVFFCELSGVRKKCRGSKCQDCFRLAQDYYKMYFQTWPEVTEYHRWVLSDVRDPWITPLTGFLRGGMHGSDAANHPFQHLTSRMSKSALLALSKRCYLAESQDVMYGTRLWGFAHDEILAEIPEDRAPEAADEMCNIMLKAAKQWCPDVLLTAEPALMDRWHKGAECIRDSSGKLLVWQPKNEHNHPRPGGALPAQQPACSP